MKSGSLALSLISEREMLACVVSVSLKYEATPEKKTEKKKAVPKMRCT